MPGVPVVAASAAFCLDTWPEIYSAAHWLSAYCVPDAGNSLCGALHLFFFVNTCKQKVSCLEKFLNQAFGVGSLAQVFTENLQLPAN